MANGEPSYSKGMKPERLLQDAFLHSVDQSLHASGFDYAILEGAGLDVSAFVRTPNGTRFRQFELKAYTSRKNRIALSEGQLKLLCDKSDRELSVVDECVRWVLANWDLSYGSARFAFFTCKDAKDSMSGGSDRRTVTNYNLNLGKFRDRLITWSDLLQKTKGFLLS